MIGLSEEDALSIEDSVDSVDFVDFVDTVDCVDCVDCGVKNLLDIFLLSNPYQSMYCLEQFTLSFL